MATKSKATRAAEIAFACFQQLPAEEQKARLKAIKKLKFRRNKSTATKRPKRQSFSSRSEAQASVRNRGGL